MTIRDVAKEAGVSPATVSRYYTGNGIVTRDTAEQIVLAAQKLHYIPKTMNKKGRRTIGVLIPHLMYGFFGEAIKELITQADMYGLELLIIPILPQDETDYKQRLLKIELSGIIYLDENINIKVYDFITSLKIKIVMCGGAALDNRAGMVHVNDMSAGYEGARYLLGLGHRKILILSDYASAISSGFQRLTGCRRAFEELGLEPDEKYIFCGEVTYEKGYEETCRFIKSGLDFTAIYAFSDEMAVGAMAALYDAHINIPGEVSVLGFDDLPIASRVRPSLTTVHQPMVGFVTRTLEAFLSEGTLKQNIGITLPHSIIERESCKKL